MYEFLDRLISIAMPRIRDFRGVSPRAFDGQGNYTLGVKEQIISPKSSTTRSIRCGAWTSPSLRRLEMTVTAERCSRHSTSRFGSNRNHKVYGEDEHGRAREASRRDREKVRGEARRSSRS